MAILNAIKASGAIVRLEPADFERLATRMDAPLVVTRRSSGLFGIKYEYLTSHKGLIFYTKSKEPVRLPGRAETIEARAIWVPG